MLDRPVHRIPIDEKAPSLKGKRDPGRHISFIPAMCPKCGWDLSGEKETSVFICHNCDSVWDSENGKLKPIECSVAATDERDVLYVPFWRMQARIEGLNLETYADLIRFANMPKAVTSKFEQQRLSFWAPAFKIKPKLFLRLLQQLTILQPNPDESTRLKDLQLTPVCLSKKEAAESIKIALAGLAVKKHQFFPQLESITTNVTASRLVFLPFRQSGYDFVQCHCEFSLSKSAFNFGRKI